MNWIVVKEEEIYRWIKTLKRFKSYIRKKMKDRKSWKEKKYRIRKKYFYTNYTRNQQDPKCQNQYSSKTRLTI